MCVQILLLLIVASAVCFVSSEPSSRKRPSGGGSGNPLGIIKAELVEEDAVGGNVDLMEAGGVGDQAEAASTQRIIIKPIKRHRGKRIHIRLVNKKPKNFVRLKVAGTKNVEQKYPGDEEDTDATNNNNQDYDQGNDEDGYESSHNSWTTDEEEDSNQTSATEESQNGEDAMKVKHHHHHHHHNHIKTVVKKVPEPYEVEKIVHVPVEKIVHVPKPYPVEKIIEKIVHVPKPYPVEKIVHVPKIVEKIVYSPLFGKDTKFGSASTSTKSFADLTTDPKLKFGASGSSLDIIYPNGHSSSSSSSFPSNTNNNGLFNSYGQPLGKHPKFPEFEDINKHSNKFHSILDNDAFDFGGLPSKPKDHHHHNNNNNHNGKKTNKKNNNNSNKNRNNKNKNNQNKNKGNGGLFGGSNSSNKPKNNFINHHGNDDFFSSSSTSNSHHSTFPGIQMPSYTHEFTVSNSDQKEVFFNPAQVSPSAAGPNHHHSHHHHQVHYESLPFKYGSSSLTDTDTEYDGHASTQSNDYSQFNWSPSMGDFGSATSAFSLPTQYTQSTGTLAAAESAQSPVGPVFRPPRKNPAGPFGGKAKRGSSSSSSFGAPRAGPRRPRNNSGESFRSEGGQTSKMAGHRPESGLRGSASNISPVVHPLRLRPVQQQEKQHLTETVMLAPEPAQE